MDAFDELWVWSDPGLAAALAWYREVAVNRRPAKFLIARSIAVAPPRAEAPEDTLWAELERATGMFLERLEGIRRGAELPACPAAGTSLLDLCDALCRRMLGHCNFCRWNCCVDRTRPGKLGACKLAAGTRVSSYFHHLGEELVYRGRHGSGTIFFTSCNMRCAFCQNGDISTDKDNGREIDARILATMAWLLRTEGCHNINWVGGDPTIHLHRIVEAITLLGTDFGKPGAAELSAALAVKADSAGLVLLAPEGACYQGAFNAPMLWNSNFYMSPEAMRILRLLIDVWLPDFKFGPGRCAITLARTPNYWETVTGNLKLIHDWGEDLTIRHLIMPGHVDCCTKPIFEWLATHMPEAPVNVMDQYHPDNFCDPRSAKYDPRYADIARRPSAGEIRTAYRAAEQFGLNWKSITREKHATGLWL